MTSAGGDDADGGPARIHCAPLDSAERDAWARFFENNYGSLLKICLLGGHSMEDAEDGAHTAMLEIRMRWPEITNREAYARRVAINHAGDLRKRRRQETARLVEKGLHLVHDTADEQLSAHESIEWTNQLLACLSPTQRKVMEQICEGLTTGEIAELLDLKPANIRKNLELARKRLKHRLEQQESRGNVARPNRSTGKEQG